jgi:hypothetical protein
MGRLFWLGTPSASLAVAKILLISTGPCQVSSDYPKNMGHIITQQHLRSILVEGRDAMKQGLIRRIGTGEGTHAWNQNWLPRDHMLRPLACLQVDPPTRVSDFIDTTTTKWNTELLSEWFLPMDVEVIRSIPLSTRTMDDRWA